MNAPALSSVDLHCHSTASDGLRTPAGLVSYAAERGLSVIGLCDHDSTSGVVEAIDAGISLGIEVVPGVELSSEIDGLQAHILGYFVDPASESLQSEFAWMNATRRARIQQICDNLNAAGIPIDAKRCACTFGRWHRWAATCREGTRRQRLRRERV